MKALILIALMAIPALARADFECSVGTAPQTIIRYNAAATLYSISVLGFRVNYAGQYRATDVTINQNGSEVVVLKKISDVSTFSTLPENLRLQVDESSATLSGLQMFLPNSVTFSQSQCTQNDAIRPTQAAFDQNMQGISNFVPSQLPTMATCEPPSHCRNPDDPRCCP